MQLVAYKLKGYQYCRQTTDYHEGLGYCACVEVEIYRNTTHLELGYVEDQPLPHLPSPFLTK